MEIGLRELIEANDFVNPVEKLRPQELTQRLKRFFLCLRGNALSEADGAFLAIGAGVGRHHDDCVLKVDRSALGIGDPAVIQNLEQNIHDVRMGLFNFVKQDHRIGLAADFFGQLAGLVIADIARRRSDHFGDGVLLHILGHIKANQGLDRFKELIRQTLDKLGFSDAGRADKDKGNRPPFCADAGAAAADCGRNRRDCFVLADNVLFQMVLQVPELLILLGLNLGSGDLGPQLDDPGKIVHVQPGLRLRFQVGDFFPKLTGLRLQGCDPGIVVLRLLCLLREHLQFQLHVRKVFGHRLQTVDYGVAQVLIGAGFIQQIDGLIGKESVRDITFRKQDRLARDFRGNLNAMIILIIRRNPEQDGNRLLNGRLVDNDGLKAAFEGGILLDILPVFLEGRGSDHLNLPSGEGGLQDICSVHRSLGVSGSDQIMHLVDHKNDIAAGLDLLDQVFHPALKLSAKLRAGNHCGHIKQEYFLIAKLERYVSGGDFLRKALGDCRLADAGLTDQAGIVFLAAVQNLNHPFRLHLPADNAIELMVPRALGQVQAIGVQKLMLFLRRGSWLAVLRGLVPIRHILILPRHSSEQLIQERERGSLAVKLIFPIRIIHIVISAHQGHHFSGEVLQIFVGNAHLPDHIINLFDAKLLCAFQTKALIRGNTVFNLRDKNHSDVFFAAAAKRRSHRILLSPSRDIQVCVAVADQQRRPVVANANIRRFFHIGGVIVQLQMLIKNLKFSIRQKRNILIPDRNIPDVFLGFKLSLLLSFLIQDQKHAILACNLLLQKKCTESVLAEIIVQQILSGQ